MDSLPAITSWAPLLELLPQGVIVTDAEGRFVEANRGACRILGKARQELLATGFFDPDWTALGPDGSRMPAEEFPGVLALRAGAPVQRRILGLVKQDEGDTQWLEISAGPLPGGGVVITFDDVTDRHRSQVILESRSRIVDVAIAGTLEEVLRATLDEAERLTGSCVGFYHFLAPDQVTLSLQAWSTRTGREFCKAEGHGLHYGVDKAGVWADAIREKRPVIHNDYASLPNRKGLPEGHAEIKRELVVPVFRGGRIIALLGVGNKPFQYGAGDVETVQRLANLAWEIAEEKRTREFLRFEAAALEYSLSGIALADFEGRLQYVNPAFVALWGLKNRHASIGSNVWEFGADPEAAKAALLRLIAEGQPIEGEMQALREDGTRFDAQFTATLARDGTGRPLGVLASFLNISETKRVREALRQRTHDMGERVKELDCLYKLSLLAEASGDSLELLLQDAVELLPPAWQYPEITGARITLDERSFTTHGFEQTAWRQQRPIRVRGAQVGTVEVNYTQARSDSEDGPFLWHEGKLLEMVAERLGKAVDGIRTRQALRDALQFNEQIIGSAQEGIIVYGPDLRYRAWNPFMERLTGMPASEVLGKHPLEVFPFLRDVGVLERVELVLGGRAVDALDFPYEVPGGGKSGWVTDNVAPLRNDTGDIIGVIGMVGDITERRQAEEGRTRLTEELRGLRRHYESAREAESQRLARNIHDEVGQQLTVARMDLEAVRRMLVTASPDIRERLVSLDDTLTRAVATIRQIATELRPPMLDDLGLVATCEWRANEYRKRAGMPCSFRATPPDFAVAPELATSFFRVLQEALTNVSRHAGASAVVVDLRSSAGSLELTVTDDGRGITPEEASNPAAFGLVQMRERAIAHGGQLVVAGNPGAGTTVRMTVPLAPEAGALP